MSITKRAYGKTVEGNVVDIFTLMNTKGLAVEITNFGGIIVSLKTPDSKGQLEDIVLGYDQLEGYMKKGPYFGAVIGRYANRIANGSFELNGLQYNVAKNEGENHLHGGIVGFDKVVWEAETVKEGENENLVLSYTSADGEEGYPGKLDVKVTYALSEDNGLSINYSAVTDKDTIINLTNHSYFNLSGHDSGNILAHEVMLNADKFTVVDKYSIPTGELRAVEGTPLDFTEMTPVGNRINSDYEQIVFGGGYDHNFVINQCKCDIKKAAEVYDPATGRFMEVYTTKPGIQLYTGNFLDGTEIGKGGTAYGKRSGLCLETQFFPNSINEEHFPTPILRVGDTYHHKTIYKFSVR